MFDFGIDVYDQRNDWQFWPYYKIPRNQCSFTTDVHWAFAGYIADFFCLFLFWFSRDLPELRSGFFLPLSLYVLKTSRFNAIGHLCSYPTSVLQK